MRWRLQRPTAHIGYTVAAIRTVPTTSMTEPARVPAHVLQRRRLLPALGAAAAALPLPRAVAERPKHLFHRLRPRPAAPRRPR